MCSDGQYDRTLGGLSQFVCLFDANAPLDDQFPLLADMAVISSGSGKWVSVYNAVLPSKSLKTVRNSGK
ncbi:hypothetical protein Q4O60_17925 [Aeribacillus pallidus]|nr:hypothetical protein [Aeribacillus pallidus]